MPLNTFSILLELLEIIFSHKIIIHSPWRTVLCCISSNSFFFLNLFYEKKGKKASSCFLYFQLQIIRIGNKKIFCGYLLHTEGAIVAVHDSTSYEFLPSFTLFLESGVRTICIQHKCCRKVSLIYLSST